MAIFAARQPGGTPQATHPWMPAAGWLSVVLAVLLARIVWMFPATYLPRRFSKKIRDRSTAWGVGSDTPPRK